MLLDLTFCVTPHVHRAHSHFEIEFTQVRRIASDLKDKNLKTKFTYGKNQIAYPYFYAVWASLIPCT